MPAGQSSLMLHGDVAKNYQNELMTFDLCVMDIENRHHQLTSRFSSLSYHNCMWDMQAPVSLGCLSSAENFCTVHHCNLLYELTQLHGDVKCLKSKLCNATQMNMKRPLWLL